MSGAPADEGETRANSSLSSTWVLDDADDGPAPAVEGESLPELEPEERRHAVGDGDLAGAFRVAASAERKPRVRSARVLGAELHLLDAARHGQRAVADDVGRPEPFLGGGETRLQLARIGAVELEEGIGRAELGVVQRPRVVGDRDAGRSRPRPRR